MNPLKYKEDLHIYNDIKKEVRSMRIITALFFAVPYILLAKDNRYFYLTLLFGFIFLLVQVLKVKSPWIPVVLTLLLNVSIVATTGIQRSPFMFLFLLPVITHGIERELNWALRVAFINVVFLVIFEIYSAITGDFFGVGYISSVIVLMYYLSKIIVKAQGSILSYATDMKEKAYLDPLTGLYNRRALEEYINSMILNKVPFTLVMCDLDEFKRYNDTYGHQAGDMMLKKFADILKTSIRSSDLSFRYGGDEFVILLLGELENLTPLYDRIKNKLKEQSNDIGVSFGVAIFPKDGKSLDRIISIADNSLYEKKKSLNNRNISSF